MKAAITRVWRPVSLALAVVLVSCGPSECVSGPLCEGGGTQTPTTLTLSMTTIDFASVGATQQLSASVADQNGQAMTGVSVTWLSSNPGAATVSGGLVTSVGNGTATITATAGAASGTATVSVTQVATAVSATPTDVLIESIGGTQALSAVAVDAEDSEVAGHTFTWSSDTESVATVDSDGVVTAVSEGTAEITVETTSGSSTLSDVVTVTVDVPLTITTVELPAGVVTVPYTPAQLQAAGGSAYVWALAAGSGPLPTGLTLSAGGSISGTPTVAGTFSFFVSVESGGTSVQQSLSITIEDVPVLSLASAEMAFTAPTGSTTSMDRALDVTNDGGSVLQWGVSSDQTWLTLSPASGATSNTDQVTVTADPTGLETGKYTATITATAAAPATGSPQTTTVTLTVAPLLGNSVDLGGNSGNSPNFLLGSPLVVTTSTTLTHLAVIARAAGDNFKMALYSDVDGEPDSLLASTASQATVIGVQELPVTPVSLPAGVYWIMGNFETSGSIGFSNTVPTTVVKYISLPFANAIPAVFPDHATHSTYTGQEFNYYILVTDAQASDGPLGGPARIGPAAVNGAVQTSPPGN